MTKNHARAAANGLTAANSANGQSIRAMIGGLG